MAPPLAEASVEEASATQAEPVPAPLPHPAAASGPMPDAAPPVVEAESLLLEECFALYRAKQYADLVSVAESQLQRASDSVGGTEHAPVVAALWGLVGLSKQALSDDAAACAAFEAAIRASPAAGRYTYQRYLTSLTSRVAHQLLDRAETFGKDEEDERVATLKQAVLWLRRGVGAAPDDENLRISLDRAREGLWTAYDRIANVLVQRLEFDRARAQILEVLADEELPADRREAFKDLLSSTYAGEIEQLTAHALRALQDGQDQEMLISLGRITVLLSSISEDALAPKRREEAYRRLWWAYTKLGLRRVEAREFETALEPLFHALKIDVGDPERQAETREALVRSLEAIADSRTGVIGQLLKDGQREAALAEGERLLSLIREGMDAGLSDEEIAAALTKTRRIIEQVQQG